MLRQQERLVLAGVQMMLEMDKTALALLRLQLCHLRHVQLLVLRMQVL